MNSQNEEIKDYSKFKVTQLGYDNLKQQLENAKDDSTRAQNRVAELEKILAEIKVVK